MRLSAAVIDPACLALYIAVVIEAPTLHVD